VIAVLVLTQKVLPAKAAIDMPLALAIAGLGVLIVIGGAGHVKQLFTTTKEKQ
jgi:hypothetical protein